MNVKEQNKLLARIKVCTRCNQVLPIEMFSKNCRMVDGYSYYCKKCIAVCHKKYYKKNKAKINTINKHYYKKNREHIKIQKMFYRHDNAEKVVERNVNWRKEHPLAVKAYYIVQSSNLIPEPCVKCSSTENVEAHHEDYSKPLDVIWMCVSCHQIYHHKKRSSKW